MACRAAGSLPDLGQGSVRSGKLEIRNWEELIIH